MPRITLRVLLLGTLSTICVAFFLVLTLDLLRIPHSVRFIATQGKEIIDFTAEAEYWKARIAAVGGVNAYRELSDSVNGMTVGNQHIAAHTFGEALYDVEGLAGFSVCDNDFSQGCFHQFFGSSVQAEGIDTSLRETKGLCAAQARIEDRRTCEHGLGHGILGYLGYDLKNLTGALSMCKKLCQKKVALSAALGVHLWSTISALSSGPTPVSVPCQMILYMSHVILCQALIRNRVYSGSLGGGIAS